MKFEITHEITGEGKLLFLVVTVIKEDHRNPIIEMMKADSQEEAEEACLYQWLGADDEEEFEELKESEGDELGDSVTHFEIKLIGKEQ